MPTTGILKSEFMAAGKETKYVAHFFRPSWATAATQALLKIFLASSKQPMNAPEQPVAKGRASEGSAGYANQLGKHKSSKSVGQETSGDTVSEAIHSNTHTTGGKDRAPGTGRRRVHRKIHKLRALPACPETAGAAFSVAAAAVGEGPNEDSHSYEQLQATKHGRQITYTLPSIPNFDFALLWYHSTYPTGISFSHPGPRSPNSACETRVKASLLRCGDKIFVEGCMHYFCSASASPGSQLQVVKSINMVNMRLSHTTSDTFETPVVDYTTLRVQDFNYEERGKEKTLMLTVKRFGETNYTAVYLPVTAAVNVSLLVETLKHERGVRRANSGITVATFLRFGP